MPDTTVATAGVSHAEEDLSDEQMQGMLARAAARKQNNSSLKLADGESISGSDKKYSFPKLNTGEIAKPYVSTTGDVARVDSSRLVQEKDRLLSNTIRKVEDPVVVQKKNAEVCRTILTHHHTHLAYEENIPNSFFLSRVRAPSWLPFCKNDALNIIVTLRHYPSLLIVLMSHTATRT